MPLTDLRIRTLKPKPGRAERLVADSNGLYLRLRGDTRAWLFRRKSKGRVTVIALGRYPDVSLRDARLKAADLATKRTTLNPTVGEVAERWLTERILKTHRQGLQVKGYLDRAIVPDLGHKRVRDVGPAEVADVVRRYRVRVGRKKKARTEGLPAARALLAVAKGLFSYAVSHGWIERSPAAQLTQAMIGAAQAARSRVLDDDELRLVMTTDAKVGPTLRFLLATGLRLGEAYKGHREGQHWVVSAESAKNGMEHRVWLSDLALAQLDHYPWVAKRETLQHWLKKNAGGAVRGWTAHDLRRTFSTKMNEKPPKGIGVAPFIVERMINHKLGGVMAVYNHATYDDERRDALERWSTWLQALVDERPADVVPLRKASARG